MWNASFLLAYVGCSIVDDEALCSGLSPDESLSKTQSADNVQDGGRVGRRLRCSVFFTP